MTGFSIRIAAKFHLSSETRRRGRGWPLSNGRNVTDEGDEGKGGGKALGRGNANAVPLRRVAFPWLGQREKLELHCRREAVEVIE